MIWSEMDTTRLGGSLAEEEVNGYGDSIVVRLEGG